MKIVVFRSDRVPAGAPPADYAQRFDAVYADRVIGNLVGDAKFCAACGPDCVGCRAPYGRRFLDRLAEVVVLPGELPHVLERPREYVPESLPPHDVLLAIHIHEQVLIECVRRRREWGTRAVIVPMEAPDWVSPSARAEAERLCRKEGIEIAFPKPFCALNPPPGTVLAEFRETFRIGYPEVELAVKGGRIARADVKVSAPCGATYYVARWLQGKRLDDDLKYDVVARRLHSYPCTASMEWDAEIGDTVMHVSGQAHYRILAPLGKDMEKEPSVIVTPTGKTLPRPVPPAENVRQVEAAKAAVLRRAAAPKGVALGDLRRDRAIPPAAFNTALLLLRQSGRIRVEGNRVLLA